jgi:hypothetical protein
MPDLLGSNKTCCVGIIVVGAAPVNVLLLTGFPQNLFGCATDVEGERQLVESWVNGTCGRYGRFLKINLLKVDEKTTDRVDIR